MSTIFRPIRRLAYRPRRGMVFTVQPVYAATVGLQVGQATLAATAEFTKPVYTAAITGQVGPAVLNLDANYIPPENLPIGAIVAVCCN